MSFNKEEAYAKVGKSVQTREERNLIAEGTTIGNMVPTTPLRSPSVSCRFL